MSESRVFHARDDDKRANWQEWVDEESGADARELDGDCMPVLADQFHIADLQHWLDLCA